MEKGRLVGLPPELIHKIALDGWMEPKDVASLSQTCWRMATILSRDSYGRDLHHALLGVMTNVKAKRWRAARYAVGRRWFAGGGGEEGLWKEVADVVWGSERFVVDEESLAGWESVLFEALALPGASGCLGAYERVSPMGFTCHRTLFTVATWVESERLVDWLLEKGVDVDLRAADRSPTPLWIACQNGQLGIARKLVEAGADLSPANIQNETLLCVACQADGSIDVVRYLLGLGVFDVDEVGDLGRPLEGACRFGGVEMVKLLVEEGGADLMLESSEDNPLVWACYEGQGEIVEYLAGTGAWDGVPKDGGVWMSALTAAIESSWDYGAHSAWPSPADTLQLMNVIRKLIALGVDVNGRDVGGCTPLFYAARRGCGEAVSVLLERGADVEHRVVGVTAREVAAAEGHDYIVRLFDALLCGTANV